MGIYQKLADIQKELFVPKGQKNNFGNYNYRSCEDILREVKPLCDKNKCVLYLSNNIEPFEGRVYVKSIATLYDIETGEHIESVAHAREEQDKKGMDGSQITGASSSYARKYALAGLFCIDNEKDSDATNDGKKPKQEKPKQEKPKVIDDLKIKVISDKMVKKGVTADKIFTRYRLNSFKEMTVEQFTSAIGILDKMPDAEPINLGF